MCQKVLDSSVHRERPTLLESFHGRLEEGTPRESYPRGYKRINYIGKLIRFFSYHY